jgi:hypothetical protein
VNAPTKVLEKFYTKYYSVSGMNFSDCVLYARVNPRALSVRLTSDNRANSVKIKAYSGGVCLKSMLSSICYDSFYLICVSNLFLSKKLESRKVKNTLTYFLLSSIQEK